MHTEIGIKIEKLQFECLNYIYKKNSKVKTDRVIIKIKLKEFYFFGWPPIGVLIKVSFSNSLCSLEIVLSRAPS